ncbi:unnamed protein product, partial [Brachionus calyciflorus]
MKGGLYGLNKNPLSVMVWMGMTEFGLNLILLARLYLLQDLLPFAKREENRLCGTNKWVFQQDGATPHTANIEIFPSNSPDCECE